MGIVLGVIGAIVAIGLALILMWKVSVNLEFISYSKVSILHPYKLFPAMLSNKGAGLQKLPIPIPNFELSFTNYILLCAHTKDMGFPSRSFIQLRNLNKYRNLTRFWSPPTPFLASLHQGRLLKSGRKWQ